jgi:hypothetical protein
MTHIEVTSASFFPPENMFADTSYLFSGRSDTGTAYTSIVCRYAYRSVPAEIKH